MAGEVAIANLAAVRMGTASRITSLDDDRTVPRTLKAVWDAQRQAVIRDGSWNFATRGLTLAEEVLEDGVPYPWDHAFRLPAEALRLLEVQNFASRDQFEVQGKLILCDSAGPLYVRVLVDVTNMADWDATAADAFALRLAWRCGHKIAGSGFDRNACWQEYRDAISSAKRVDAKEMAPIPTEEPDSWDWARRGGWKG